MNFTAKEDYGIRAAVDLAMHRSESPIQAKEIAERQSIPEQFLEQVLASLRRSGIVRSIRGPAGGYELADEPERISVGDVLRAISGPLVQPPSADAARCTDMFWRQLSNAVDSTANAMSLRDLADECTRFRYDQSFMMNI